MKLEITSLHFCYLIHRKSGKIPHFHSKITVFQNLLVRARGNQSLRPCFSGSPDPNGPQKFCKLLVTVFEASKVLCLAVRRLFNLDYADSARPSEEIMTRLSVDTLSTSI